MTETADIVVIGAGIIGMSAAVQIARRASAKIVVLDKGAGPGEGSTGASSAVCRFKYTRPETTELARDGINAYRHWSDFLGLSDPLASYQRTGVLWLSDGRNDWPQRDAARLESLGVRAQVLVDDDVRESFPGVNPCIAPPDRTGEGEHACFGGGRHLLELDGGYVDPVDALQDCIRAGRERGVNVRFGAHVTGIGVEGGRAKSVALADGDRIACGAIVNATGPWCNSIFERVGLRSPWSLKPTRIQVAHLDRPAELRGHIPVTCDMLGGIYFRPQNRGQQIIVGSVLEEDEREIADDPDSYARFADDDFVRRKVHLLQHRLPALLNRVKVRGYSGLYTMNLDDVHPVVGATPIRGFYVANGCSGHGFKLAPAIGSLLAQSVTGLKTTFDTAVDPRFLAFDRRPIAMTSKSVVA